MNLEIENIASKIQQIWRSIYEVIHDYYFKAVKFFPTESLDHCLKQISLKTYQMKSNQLLDIALELGLYEQVVMIGRRGSDDIKEKDKTKTFHFQGQSVRTKHWFDLDHELLKKHFMTREPDFGKG